MQSLLCFVLIEQNNAEFLQSTGRNLHFHQWNGARKREVFLAATVIWVHRQFSIYMPMFLYCTCKLLVDGSLAAPTLKNLTNATGWLITLTKSYYLLKYRIVGIVEKLRFAITTV